MTSSAIALPASYYEASLTQPRTQYSVLNADIDCDVCIIGGGFAGLHTALNLQEQGLKVVLLEAKRIGIAASGRNGGHVIPEFGGSQSNFEKQLDMVSAQRIWDISHSAAERLRQRIQHYQIDCDYQTGHIEAAITPKHESSLKDWQAHIAKNYGYKNQWIKREDMPQFVGSKRYIAGVIDQNGGHLHPLKLALGLAHALQLGGGEVYEHSAMQNWLKAGEKVQVVTTNGQVTCQHLVLACNVNMETIQNNTAQRLAQRILPVGSWVIATEQLDTQLAQALIPSKAAVVDMRYILDYFRLSADNRMVFGGGCSYTGKETPANLKQIMQEKMVAVFPQLADCKVAFGWGGLIDISMNRMPDFNYADDSKRVLYMQGFSGSGVVATNAAAKVISDAILGNTQDLALFQAIRHTPFPGGKLLRGPVTAAGMLYHRLLDML